MGTFHICIVHLIRHSLAFASWKERREVAAALKPIYCAANAEHMTFMRVSSARGALFSRPPAAGRRCAICVSAA